MIESVANNTAGSAAISGAVTGGSVLGKDEFLKLLVTQLQNQDPLNPSDPTEFTAQLAQFSSLEQLFSVNESLERMSRSNQELERLSAFSLIGRQVEVAGPDFHFDGNPVEFGYVLDTPATAVNVRVLDNHGQVVAVLPHAEGEAGPHYYGWDGTGVSGQPLAPGNYSLQVERVDGDGASLVSSRISSVVSGVELGAFGSVLKTGAGDFGLSEVLSVNES